jgi:hypothetical protein
MLDDKIKHSLLLYLHFCNHPNYKYYIYNTLGIHELDFGTLQHIGIPRNIKIIYHSCMTQPDGSLCSPLIVALVINIAYQLNLELFVYNVGALHQGKFQKCNYSLYKLIKTFFCPTLGFFLVKWVCLTTWVSS